MTDTQCTIAYLQTLPPGAEVMWGDDHMDRNRPWCASRVDVRLDAAAMEQLEMNWVWTIENPNDLALDHAGLEPWQIVLPFDQQIHRIGDLDRRWYINELALPIGARPPHTAVAMYRSFRRNGYHYLV